MSRMIGRLARAGALLVVLGLLVGVGAGHLWAASMVHFFVAIGEDRLFLHPSEVAFALVCRHHPAHLIKVL